MATFPTPCCPCGGSGPPGAPTPAPLVFTTNPLVNINGAYFPISGCIPNGGMVYNFAPLKTPQILPDGVVGLTDFRYNFAVTTVLINPQTSVDISIYRNGLSAGVIWSIPIAAPGTYSGVFNNPVVFVPGDLVEYQIVVRNTNLAFSRFALSCNTVPA